MNRPERARCYHVKAWHSWPDVAAGRYAINESHDTQAAALASARALDCPLVDVISPDGRIIADRYAIQHPQDARAAWTTRDTLADA